MKSFERLVEDKNRVIKDCDDFIKELKDISLRTSNISILIKLLSAKKEKYLEWLVDLEWGKIGIPKPDIVFFLDIPFEFSQKLMKNRENKMNFRETK